MREFKIIVFLPVLVCMMLFVNVQAQRRTRPNSMKHASNEVEQASAITKIKATHIHDGVTFAGTVYVANNGSAIKIANTSIQFKNGKYYFTFKNSTDAKVNKYHAMPEEERRKKGITQDVYDRGWTEAKLGEDFNGSGKYEVIKQYNN